MGRLAGLLDLHFFYDVDVAGRVHCNIRGPVEPLIYDSLSLHVAAMWREKYAKA